MKCCEEGFITEDLVNLIGLDSEVDLELMEWICTTLKAYIDADFE